jgi:hypothetical protein
MILISVQSRGNRIANVQKESVRGKSIFLFVGKEISPWGNSSVVCAESFPFEFSALQAAEWWLKGAK